MSCVLNVLYPGTKQGNAYAASYVLLMHAQFCLRGINRLTQTLRWTFLVPGHSPSLRAATFACRNRSVSRQHQAVTTLLGSTSAERAGMTDRLGTTDSGQARKDRLTSRESRQQEVCFIQRRAMLFQNVRDGLCDKSLALCTKL